MMGATLGTVALNVAMTVLGFLGTIALTHTLGAAGYGAYAFTFAWATVLTVPAALGLSPLVVRTVAAYRERGAWGAMRGILRRTSQVVALSSALVATVAVGAGWLLIDRDSDLLAPFVVGMALVPLLSLVTLRQAGMQGIGRVVIGRVPETLVAPGLFLAFLLIAGATTGGRYSATAAVALQVAATTIAFVLGAWLLRRALPAPARTATPDYEHRAWLGSGLTLLGMSVVLALNAQLGTILVGAFDGSAEAGVFTAASRVSMLVGFLFLAATYPLMPTVARLHAAGRGDELQRLLSRAVRTVALASLPIAALLVVFAPRLLDVFGEGFDTGATSLRILVAGELVKLVAGFGGLALIMTVYERAFTKAVCAGATLNLLLGVALIPGSGSEGAAIAAAVSAVVMSVALVVAARRRLGIWSPAIGLPRSRGA